MRIIQSFWSKPSLGTKNNSVNDSRSLGGWLQAKYHYMSWALSCLRLLKLYEDVELYTDNQGKHLLIDYLGLPYTKVHVGLDDLRGYSGQLWTLGKLYVYGQQKRPFIHIDSDIIMSSTFEPRIHTAPIVAQNVETNNSYYAPIVGNLVRYFTLPSRIRAELQRTELLTVSNTGIFGGIDVDFIRSYSAQAFSIIDRNRTKLNKIDQGAFSVTIEQYLPYSMALDHGIKIEYLINETLDYTSDELTLIKFHMSPSKITYIHPLGPYKRFNRIFNGVETTLRLEYPGVYYKLLALLKYNRLT